MNPWHDVSLGDDQIRVCQLYDEKFGS